eukprot:m.56114 g.56114  ORF g.56114 m.56114 type:complete len:473 (-) comp12015_c1_seq2:218-1636(-)
MPFDTSPMRLSSLLPLPLLLLLSTHAAASENGCFGNDRDRAARMNRAINQFIQQGYEVERGYISFEPICHPDSTFCWGANPSSPYGRYKLRTPLLIDLKVPVYQLGPSEALVFFGCTPPPARYYGFQTYAFMSHDRILFASMGDSINFLNINVTNSSDPFDKEVLIVTTGDQRAAANVFSTFSAHAQVSRESMNVDVIPDAVALGIEPIGYGLNHTIFNTLFRVALCDNAAACASYMNHNWTVLRVRPLNSPTPTFYPLKPERERWTGVTEDSLETPLQTLLQNVRTQFLKPGSHVDEVRRIYPLFLEGRTCIKQLTNCLGDTRDAVYMDGDEPLNPAPRNQGSFLLTDSPNDFLVVVGVLHASAPMKLATYTNLAVYLPSKAMGVLAVVDKDLVGSSQPYPGGGPYYYVAKFARHCNGEKYCTEVPTTFPGVPLASNLTFTERAYVNPATQVGADPRALQAPYVIHYVPDK